MSSGVDDNLPLVTAQATLASAQTNYVQSLYQYNLAKLSIARAAGVIELEIPRLPGEIERSKSRKPRIVRQVNPR